MIHILRDDERLALFRQGRYHGLKGPGIVTHVPFLEQPVRLRVGDTGNLISVDMARFGQVNLPVTGKTDSSPVHIVAYDDEHQPPCPRVEPVASRRNR